MIGVFLVEVIVLSRTDVFGQGFEETAENAVYRLLLGGIAMPDGDEVRREAD